MINVIDLLTCTSTPDNTITKNVNQKWLLIITIVIFILFCKNTDDLFFNVFRSDASTKLLHLTFVWDYFWITFLPTHTMMIDRKCRYRWNAPLLLIPLISQHSLARDYYSEIVYVVFFKHHLNNFIFFDWIPFVYSPLFSCHIFNWKHTYTLYASQSSLRSIFNHTFFYSIVLCTFKRFQIPKFPL